MNERNTKQTWSTAGLAVASAVAGLGLCACASIVHGNHQQVAISSVPSGASVTVDNAARGTTPLVASLTRKDTHVVRLELPGYRPYEATLNRKLSGWFWGNIVFGGLIGIGVDAISGGMYRLSPEEVSAAMVSGQARVTTLGDGLYVVATLEPRPDWVKIGQLERQ